MKLIEQSRKFTKHDGSDVIVRFMPHNYGIDVTVTLYKGGLEGATIKDTVLLVNQTYTDAKAMEAQVLYDHAVMVLQDKQ